MQSFVEVIINSGSGADNDCEKLKLELIELFQSHNLDAHVSVAEKGEDLPKLAEKAVAGNCESVVAGGGDGTISAVAAKLIGTKKTLGVLPLGTLNHFSKDLNIPQNVAEAVRVIAENHTQEIDVGSVNEHIFINNSSIGLYPSIVRQREKQQHLGKSKWSAALWATLKIFLRSPFLKVKTKIEGEEILRKTPFIFVGNNEYEMNFFNVGTRTKLDDGKLSVYFLHRPGRIGLLRLAFRIIFGRLKQMKDFEAINTEEITIETRKKHILVAFDGEIQVLQTPLCYKIQPGALRVIVPREVSGF